MSFIKSDDKNKQKRKGCQFSITHISLDLLNLNDNYELTTKENYTNERRYSQTVFE